MSCFPVAYLSLAQIENRTLTYSASRAKGCKGLHWAADRCPQRDRRVRLPYFKAQFSRLPGGKFGSYLPPVERAPALHLYS